MFLSCLIPPQSPLGLTLEVRDQGWYYLRKPPSLLPSLPPTISASLWMAGHSVLTMLSYHGSARPRKAASSPSSECLDNVDFYRQGDGAEPSGPLSGTPLLAGGPAGTSPRQTSLTSSGITAPGEDCSVLHLR